MTQTHTCDPLAGYKAQAKRLRETLALTGLRVAHAQALEMIAHQHGLRDWNTLRASVTARPAPLGVGHRVQGHYLNQRFEGVIKGLTTLAGGDRRIVIRFDDPVDVVRFDSFSSLRRQITAVIGPDGRSARKTSDGVPHLVLDPGPGVS